MELFLDIQPKKCERGVGVGTGPVGAELHQQQQTLDGSPMSNIIFAWPRANSGPVQSNLKKISNIFSQAQLHTSRGNRILFASPLNSLFSCTMKIQDWFCLGRGRFRAVSQRTSLTFRHHLLPQRRNADASQAKHSAALPD